MRTLWVELGRDRYPIYIGANLLVDQNLLKRHLKSQQVFIVTNKTIAPYYITVLKAALEDLQCDVMILPDGEKYKTLETASQIFDALMDKNHHRNTTLIALGGGVIGDLTGFAAACYQRGVNFIQIPTSLLAQVDASIGGKTAVNHPKGKNMIGAFHQPKCVIIDTDTLKTLPERELCAGLAEVIKIAAVGNAEFFNWLESNIAALITREELALNYAIERAAMIKARIVAADEKETGSRALLNLGHTFGHAIETGLGYGKWLHGEAVSVGLVLAASLSQSMGWLTETEVERIVALLRATRLPIQLPPNLDASTMIELMAHDKKIVSDQIRFILLQGLGSGVITNSVPEEKLLAVLKQGASSKG